MTAISAKPNAKLKVMENPYLATVIFEAKHSREGPQDQ